MADAPSFAHGAIGPPIVLDPDQPQKIHLGAFFPTGPAGVSLRQSFIRRISPYGLSTIFAALAHSSGASLIGATTTAE